MPVKALTKAQFRKYLARRHSKESFKAIADDLGVTRQAVEQWHNGDNQPSKLVLLVVAMHIQIEKRVK
jgi:transcriptional regulator with XRE-family HTH domain